MQQVTISEIKSKPTKPRKDGTTGTFTQITTTSGAKASGFDATLANLKQGDIIEWTTETDGQFITIKDWKLVTKAADRPSGDVEKEAKERPPADNRDASMAVSYVKDLMVAGVLDKNSPLAALALSWITSRIVATGAKADLLFPKEALPDKTGEASKVATGATPAQRTGTEQDTGALKMPDGSPIPEFTDLRVFLTFWCKQNNPRTGGRFTQGAIGLVPGVRKALETDDFQTASACVVKDIVEANKRGA